MCEVFLSIQGRQKTVSHFVSLYVAIVQVHREGLSNGAFAGACRPADHYNVGLTAVRHPPE